MKTDYMTTMTALVYCIDRVDGNGKAKSVHFFQIFNMEITIHFQIPEFKSLAKTLGWFGFGFCTKCGSKMIDGGWYEEKSFCVECLKKVSVKPR